VDDSEQVIGAIHLIDPGYPRCFGAESAQPEESVRPN
jgi:hypothetical protein